MYFYAWVRSVRDNANESNRGVYVPAFTIDENGRLDWQEGRKTTEIGRVLELNSKGRIDQYAVVLDGTYEYYKDGVVSFSYTWNDIRDNTSYSGDVANSSTLSLMVHDDPRDQCCPRATPTRYSWVSGTASEAAVAFLQGGARMHSGASWQLAKPKQVPPTL